MLKDKVAVIYGAGGAIGGAVARAFASEGAEVFLTGRSLFSVEAVADDVLAAGGSVGTTSTTAREMCEAADEGREGRPAKINRRRRAPSRRRR